MTNALLAYLTARTPEERCEFAAKAGSSAMSLRLAAHGYKTQGTLAITPEFAARIEAASDGALSRLELSTVCAACPHACASHAKDPS